MKSGSARGMVLPGLALLAMCASTGSHAIQVNIDQFSVVRNGATVFNDTFPDGAPPPSAPSFVSGAPASYSVFGTVPAGAESGGLLQLDSANGGATGYAFRTSPFQIQTWPEEFLTYQAERFFQTCWDSCRVI